ncbi:MAG: glycosyltransferase family 39 protein [Desulfobacterales bacterium]|nr:glycosyltransferase family 39 protein [Desulfobacterales bacterium]
MQKIFNSSYYFILLFVAYLILIGVIIYTIDFYPKSRIEEILKILSPINLKINFFLILLAILLCRDNITNAFRKFKNKQGIVFLIVIILGLLIVSFVTPQIHRIYYDEDIYANIGQNIALSGKTGFSSYGTFEYDEYFPHWITYNKEPSAWPFLISLVFNIFGVNEIYAFYLDNLLFTISVLTVFFIAWSISSNFYTSILSAISYIIIPHNLTWSNTLAAEPSAACFTGITILCLILFIKNNQNRYLFLLTTIAPFACQFRPESMMVLFISFFAVGIFSPSRLIKKEVWSFALITFLFLVPHILHLYAVSGNSWGAQGDKFSLEFFTKNVWDNGMYYLNNKQFPLILTILAFIGLILSNNLLKYRMVILLWFLLFWGIFLFFYAGSYFYGADVRFSLLSFMPLSILAGMGGYTIIRIFKSFENTFFYSIVISLIFSFIVFLPLVRQEGQEAWGARYDHEYAKKFIEKIPKRSIVLTQNPTMFLLWGQSALQTYAGPENEGLIRELLSKYNGHVYFHYNYWCNTKNARNVRLCKDMEEKYNLQEIMTAYEQDYKYGLYKMSLK